MRNVKLLSAVVTHRSHLRHSGAGRQTSRHVVTDANGRVMSTTQRDEGDSCIRAPRVGAFATDPWTDAAPCEPNTGY